MKVSSSPSLTKAEREIILVIADDEKSWHVHTDSLRAASTRLRKVAAAYGVTPQRAGTGYGFDLPLAAVRFASPKGKRQLSDAQRDALRVRFQDRNLARRRPIGQGELGLAGGDRPSAPKETP